MTRVERNKEKQKEIVTEKHSINRKKIVTTTIKILLIIVVCFSSIYLYIANISTRKTLVKEKRIIDKSLPKNFDGLKVIQFSDLHYKNNKKCCEDLSNVILKINERNPDIVVFTGDLIAPNTKLSTKQQEKIINELKKIKAKLGKYAIYGDEDNELFNTIMKQSNFTILDNNFEFIYNENKIPILITGTNSMLKNKCDIDKSFEYFTNENNNKNIYTISLIHEPDLAKYILNKYTPNIILAGHSHNGDIKIPFIGAIHKYKGAEIYDQEYYKIKNTELYISSGLGTKKIKFRLFNRPSINFFRISSK